MLLKKKTSPYEKKICWDEWNKKTKADCFDFCEDYKEFLSAAKTERLAVSEGEKLLIKHKFLSFEEFRHNPPLNRFAGSKVYFNFRGKNLGAFILGKEDISRGINLIASHIDSPRLDLKVNPLYEDDNLAFLKTHYYGGIKKYHWPTLPLAIYGVVVTASGKTIPLAMGDKEDDPIFMITDLLPHLGKKQMEKPMKEFIEAEKLNVLVASIPLEKAKSKKIKERVKQAILEKMAQKGLSEEDFVSAEIEMVPAGCARDLGLDRSLIVGYGHDDRVCAYTSLRALLDQKGIPQKTCLCFWTDKEEIGSTGSTGMKSNFLRFCLSQMLRVIAPESRGSDVDRVFFNSHAISGDVDMVQDPNFKEFADIRNVGELGRGGILVKYTGYGGKYETSDADAEYLAKLRNIFNKNKVIWQTGQLGKVDEGGGGTIAKYLAQLGPQVVDFGVGLLNMHAPFEIASKADIYATYQAYTAFYKEKL